MLCTCDKAESANTPSSPVASRPVPAVTACLCIFDITRTLTGRQGKMGSECPGNRIVPGVWDSSYFGGDLTLSSLAAAGINTTFCGSCYLGVISAGVATGAESDHRHYLTQYILRTPLLDKLASSAPELMKWSMASQIVSPFVLGQKDFTKHTAVPAILNVYRKHGISIALQNVYYFGDRAININTFKNSGMNARQVSCASRDQWLWGSVGYCGARSEEIVAASGIALCNTGLSQGANETSASAAFLSASPKQCDSIGQWPRVKEGVVHGKCSSLVQTSLFQGRCDRFCASFGHTCTTAALEVDQDYLAKTTARCDQPIEGRSNMFCTCEKSMTLSSLAPQTQLPPSQAACLCIFDVDRILTGKQGSANGTCINNQAVAGVWDGAFNGGELTLSELSAKGINSTFCGACYLAVIAAGWVSGPVSAERHYLEKHVLSSAPHSSLVRHVPHLTTWSAAWNISSLFVVGQEDFAMRDTVYNILEVYKQNGLDITSRQVHFFGRFGSVNALRNSGVNAREVSCGSRDPLLDGVVGYCGASPQEIIATRGIKFCQ